MTRWTVFDSSTAEAAQRHHASLDDREHASVADAIVDTVASQRSLVIVVPADGDEVTVARITPPDTRAT